MSMTKLTYHLVFGTYQRLPTIEIANERQLYQYIYNHSQKKGVKIRRIGGMPDHVHILCDIPPYMAVASYVKTLKSESSKFLRATDNFPEWQGWAKGYGGFSVDVSTREIKRRYIMRQKEHHRGISFADEYRSILDEEGFDKTTPILGDDD